MGIVAGEHAQPSLLRDLVMLTKPRIISLLLVTTVAPMFVAGNPGWLLVVVVSIGGYLMAGGANGGEMSAASGARRRSGAAGRGYFSARALHQRARRAASAGRILFLCLRVHALAQAHDTAEHRDRR